MFDNNTSSEGSGIDRDQQDDVFLHHLTGRDPSAARTMRHVQSLWPT